MKDKEKQIEEMGKVMPEKIKDPLDNSRYIIFGKSLRREIARIYYNAGYRKIPEDSVVLSREEYEKLKNESIDKLFAEDTFFKEEFKANEEHLRKRASRDYIKLVKKQSSKETAEKIYNFANDFFVWDEEDFLSRLAEYIEQFGVEIKE